MSSPRPISPRKKSKHNNPALHHANPQRRSPSPPAKKRRIDDGEEGLDDLMRLYNMAKETMNYCEGRLRKIVPWNRGPALRESGGFKSLANIHAERNEEDIITKSIDKIGGIPREFLDLRHFNPKKFPEESAHVIDCTDENAADHLVRDSFRDEHIHDGLKAENEGRGCSAQKHAANRINIRNAPLPHVNGTYIQEGTYNGAPLFVRVGPPRKFMGKWDCCVVLRRESDITTPEGTNVIAAAEGVWKIGLVPAHTITHPRLIGYYEASEKGEGEPPAMGWKVFQEGGKGRVVGGLRILYEE